MTQDYLLIRTSDNEILQFLPAGDPLIASPSSGNYVMPNDGQLVGDIYDINHMQTFYFVNRVTGAYAGSGYVHEIPDGYIDVGFAPTDATQSWDFTNQVFYWTKDTLKKTVGAVSFSTRTTGITFNGAKLLGDSYTFMPYIIQQAEKAKDESPSDPRSFMDSLNVTYDVTNADVIEVADAILDHVQRCYDSAGHVSSLIDSLTIMNPTNAIAEFNSQFTYLGTHPVSRTKIVAQYTTALDTKLQALPTNSALTAILAAKATPGDITTAINGLLNGAPSAFDTLKEISDQLSTDESAVLALTTTVGGKVDKVTGKGLSANDFTDLLKAKLDALSTVRTTSGLTLTPVAPGTTTGGNTGTQISASKDASVRVTYATQIAYSLAGGVTSNVTLKKCATNAANEASWTECGSTETNQNTGLAVTVGQTVGAKGQICADIPAGWYVKAVKTGAGTHTEAFVSGEQTIFG